MMLTQILAPVMINIYIDRIVAVLKTIVLREKILLSTAIEDKAHECC